MFSHSQPDPRIQLGAALIVCLSSLLVLVSGIFYDGGKHTRVVGGPPKDRIYQKIRLNLRPRGGGTLKLTPACWPRTKNSIMRPRMQQADLMCFLLKQTIQFLTDIMASFKKKSVLEILKSSRGSHRWLFIIFFIGSVEVTKHS